MKRILLVLFILSLSACSVEEHNRKALADKQASMEQFWKELQNDPDADIREFESYTQINLQNVQKDIRGGGSITRNTTPETLRTTEYYFVKKGHYAYPTIVIREQSERDENSWWTWQSTAEKKLFNKWFQEELWFSKFPADNSYICAERIREKNICGSFHQDEMHRLTRQSTVSLLIKDYRRCSCTPDS